MSASEDLSVPYHQQDTGYYCGAACAQMVLGSIGAGLLDQDDLYNDNHTHSTTEANWYTAPDGLLWTMNNRKPPAPTFNNYFVMDALDHEDALSRAIVWTIFHYKVAPIALVFGSQHWVVVRGYTTSAQPTGFDDTNYSISGFMINNPLPQVPSGLASPPPHSATDGCGGGGTRGIADEHISYVAWQSSYMTGVPAGHWAGKFVAICDPDPPPSRPGRPPEMMMKPLSGERIIDSALAVQQAEEGLKVYGLLNKESFRKAAQGASAGKPVLVQRLDRPDSFYYITPFSRPDGTVPLLVANDARTGIYLQSAAGHDMLQGMSLMLDTKAASGLIVGRKIELPERLGRIMVRAEGMSQHPALVWKPCRESMSPLMPFHLFTVGEHRVYVRIDGAIFTSLHDNGCGI
ncbi:C39 family peptidase [Paraburkholderia xenovorans]|uniref:C39 family peptidase n=1 Tax=Paraburkholderia xenovorans TaxID=36873 RepID=UPI0038BBFB3A